MAHPIYSPSYSRFITKICIQSKRLRSIKRVLLRDCCARDEDNSLAAPVPSSRQVICSLDTFRTQKHLGFRYKQPVLTRSLYNVKITRVSAVSLGNSEPEINDEVVSHGSPGITDVVKKVQTLPLKRFAIWTAFAAVLYILKDFLGLMFGTFVMSYLANSVINVGLQYLPVSRRALTLAFFFFVVMLVVGFGLHTIPMLAEQGAVLATRIQSNNPYVLLGEYVREVLGWRVASQLETLLTLVASSSSQDGGQLLSAAAASAASSSSSSQAAAAGSHHHLGLLIKAAVQNHATTATLWISSGLIATAKVTLQVTLSMILSFMIVWDLPALKSCVTFLKTSRLKEIYLEVGPHVSAFGALLAKSLQAQVIIAVVNTVLTSAGVICVLKLPQWTFLAAVVFFSSFIPVAGVVLSTVPIAFTALAEVGPATMALSIVMVLIIHAVEAYVLNPTIYSQHLHLHPILVIAVLVVAEHEMGVFGLLLAVPLMVFTIEHILKQPKEMVTSNDESKMSSLPVDIS